MLSKAVFYTLTVIGVTHNILIINLLFFSVPLYGSDNAEMLELNHIF